MAKLLSALLLPLQPEHVPAVLRFVVPLVLMPRRLRLPHFGHGLQHLRREAPCSFHHHDAIPPFGLAYQSPDAPGGIQPSLLRGIPNRRIQRATVESGTPSSALTCSRVLSSSTYRRRSSCSI